jgi:hypothetical protein
MEILAGNQTAASVAYRLCDYGDVPDTEQAIILMGAGVRAAGGGDDE